MMYPFLTLDDGTEIVHSERKPDGRVKVYVEKPDEKICEVAIAALKAALSGEVPEEEMPVNKDDDAQGEEAAETETAEEETAAEETEETAETVSAGAESPREDPADEES